MYLFRRKKKPTPLAVQSSFEDVDIQRRISPSSVVSPLDYPKVKANDPNYWQIIEESATKQDPSSVLPPDVFCKCIAFVVERYGLEYLANAARVSKKWHQICSMNSLWMELFEHRWPLNKGNKNDKHSWLVAYRAELAADMQDYQEQLAREQRKKQMEQMDRMVCRMFHSTNGRHNFQSVPTEMRKEDLPDRETLKSMLQRENELRLCDDVQEQYRVSECPTKVTEAVQRRVVEEFGYKDLHILRSAISLYKDDPEISQIPHYVRFNRSRQGNLKVGDKIPNPRLVSLDGCKDLQLSQFHQAGRPLILVAGSYT